MALSSLKTAIASIIAETRSRAGCQARAAAALTRSALEVAPAERQRLLDQVAPVTEAPKKRAFAYPRGAGNVVHGHLARTVRGREEVIGGLQDRLAVPCCIGSFFLHDVPASPLDNRTIGRILNTNRTTGPNTIDSLNLTTSFLSSHSKGDGPMTDDEGIRLETLTLMQQYQRLLTEARFSEWIELWLMTESASFPLRVLDARDFFRAKSKYSPT